MLSRVSDPRKRTLALRIGLCVAATLAAGIAPAITPVPASPLFAAPVRLDGVTEKKSIGLPNGTEPRIAVAPDGRLWVITGNPAGRAEVLSSADGLTWTKAVPIPNQQIPGPDVDIVVTRTGRVIVTELILPGPVAHVFYSDDAGASWKPSLGPALFDQDRPWLAVGPDDSVTHQPRVYLLFHDLFTGEVLQNMFVSESRDGGGTFGLPVPLTLPGEAAFGDLQCGDSSGPSSLSVNPRTGRLYAVWGTRTSPLGGCGAAVPPGEVEFSVEAPTRIWVATSPDGSPGSWRTSLAVDDSAGGNELGVLWSPAAVDAVGNVYVAYPETPNAYPDYTGGAVRYRWAPPDLSRWSAPVTVAAPGGPGHIGVHVIAGAPGRLDFAYLAGVERPGQTPAWFVTVAQTLDATSKSPHIAEVRVSAFPSYADTATALAGHCAEGPAAGLEQGLLCSRAADNFGVALMEGRLVVAWPAVKNDADKTHAGTWVSVQTGGPGVR